MKDLFHQMRDAQKHMKQLQEQMASLRVEAETGGGMVKATVDGEANLVDLQLDMSLLEGDEIKVLPKLIVRAVQEAQKKAKAQMADQVKNMAGGLDLPGMFR